MTQVFKDMKIAFIGSGVMGGAFIKGLLHQELVSASQIMAADPHELRGKELVNMYGIQFTTDNMEAAIDADIIILSTKPQVMDKALKPLFDQVNKAKLIISIAAGVRTETLYKALNNPRIVRAMPNTPGQIGEGITVWTATQAVGEAERVMVELLLGALGKQIYVEEEKQLDMATALSGTGPAYFFLFLEALIDAGVHLGFSRSVAEQLVLQTAKGSLLYVESSGLHPAQLRNQVTSPGGTTANAIYEMEKGGIRTVVSKAIWSAYTRAVELGKSDSDKKE